MPVTNFTESEVKTISKSSNTLSIKDFCGINSASSSESSCGISDILNFRILPDGSLEKREGFRHLLTLASPIRAIWSGKLDGKHQTFALSGKDIYLINEKDGSATVVASTEGNQGEAQFFYYRKKLYLLDGRRIREISELGISEPTGYTPLIGKDWTEAQVGAPHEAKNALNSRARISYVISDNPAAILMTGERIRSVESVTKNGTVLPLSEYFISSSGISVTVRGLSAGDRVTVHFTYEASEYRTAALMENTRAAVFGGAAGSRPFLWNGNNGTEIFCGAYVTESSLSASQAGHSDSDFLYFPEESRFSVGDGAFPITAISRHYGRLLIFTEGGAWMADSDECATQEFPLMMINSTAKLVSHGDASRIYNDPVTVGKYSVYRWSADTDELDECNFHSISSPVDDLIGDLLDDGSVFFNEKRNELWLYSPTVENTLWVYSIAKEGWVRFDGITADGFIAFEETVGFYRGKKMFVFDEQLTCDEGNKEISACVTSHVSDFSSPKRKRLSAMEMCACGGDITAEVYLDGNASPAYSAKLEFPTICATKRQRLTAGRFNSVSFRLVASYSGKQKIYFAGIIIHKQ